MSSFDEQIAWIEGRTDRMIANIERWSAINSGSHHRAGLEAVTDAVASELEGLGARMDRVALPGWDSVDDEGRPLRFETAPALVLRKRPEAPRRVLLAIHLDTVFAPTSDFQTALRVDPQTLRGPGVADAKGGVALVATALEALERSGEAERLGWTLLLNPDEEIGSPCSMGLLAEEAAAADFGLVFEPCLPDGALIGARGGSGNFVLVVRGRSAHVGRAFGEGRSAIHALAAMITEIADWNDSLPDVVANAGVIRGGTARNVVPDLAVAQLNLRVAERPQQADLEARLAELARRTERSREVVVEIHGRFLSPPKPVDAPMESLMRAIERSGRDVGVPIEWRRSGGVCDGNKLAAAGLPNVDTMGPRGGDIHTDREYLLVESLAPRAALCAALLHRYARGDFHVRR